MADDLLTYAEAAQFLNFRTGTLYSMVARGRIPHVRLGRRLVRFSRAALETWLREHAVAVAPERGATS